MICQKLYEEDQTFAEFKSKFEYSFMAHKCVVDDIKRDCLKAKMDLKSSKNMFDMILKQDPDAEDQPYGKVLGKFLVDQEANVQKSMDQCDLMVKEYVEICDFFMLQKSDEMRTKSEKFFIFFTEFFNEVQKLMPKPEVKKKAKAALGSAVKKAG